MICISKQSFLEGCTGAVALYLAIMEQVIALSTQNPLSLLVKFGMMAWNNSCGNDNCSGHGECHNGTCLCEVILLLTHIKLSRNGNIDYFISDPI